jgi:hypothetical protein
MHPRRKETIKDLMVLFKINMHIFDVITFIESVVKKPKIDEASLKNPSTTLVSAPIEQLQTASMKIRCTLFCYV